MPACSAPRVLRPMFELAGRTLQGMRDLKRWVRDPGAIAQPAVAGDLEVLGIAVADRPGTETVESAATAGAFAAAFSQDFDGVLHLHCGRRSLAAMAGDLAAQLGLRLEGEFEANLARLGEFCAARRLLIVLENAAQPVPELVFGGRCSTLVSAEAAVFNPAPETLEAVEAAFFPQEAPWPELCALARQGRRLAREQGRMAEACELMQEWYTAAETIGDRTAVEEAAREMVWILEGWGRTEDAGRLEYRRALEWDEQMLLPF